MSDQYTRGSRPKHRHEWEEEFYLNFLSNGYAPQAARKAAIELSIADAKKDQPK